MNKDKQVIKKIKEVLDKLSPFIIADGGYMEFVKYEDGIVYVRFGGACAECGLLDLTLKDGIEMALIEEIPEVKEVKNVDIN